MGFRLVIGFIEHVQNVTTNNYNSLTELHTPKVTVTTEQINSSVFTSRSLLAASNRRTFPYLWVPELSPASATSFSLLTNATLKWKHLRQM
jgi:hypothetical protein